MAGMGSMLPYDSDSESSDSENLQPIYVERTPAQQIEDNEKSFTCVNKNGKRHILRHDVYQLDCGHRICKNCISKTIQEGNTTNCPGTKKECSSVDLTNPDHMFHDYGAERDLKNLIIYCPNKDEGCPGKFPWIQIEEHLDTCDFKERFCENKDRGCKSVFHNEEDLANHQRNCWHRTQWKSPKELEQLISAKTSSTSHKIHKNNELNIVLVGATGSGKSSTGNTIVGSQEFLVSGRSTHVITPNHQARGTLKGKTITVVDTPGIVDSTCPHHKEVLKEISQAIQKCPEGLDAICLVIKYPTRLTAEERNTLQILTHLFGNNFIKYTILIITGGDTYKNEMRNANRRANFKDYIQSARASGYTDTVGMLIQSNVKWVLFNNFEQNEVFKSRQLEILLRNIETTQKKMNGRYKPPISRYQVPSLLPIQRTPVANIARQQNCNWVYSNSYNQENRQLMMPLGYNHRIININGVQIPLHGILTTLYGHGVQVLNRTNYCSPGYNNFYTLHG